MNRLVVLLKMITTPLSGALKSMTKMITSQLLTTQKKNLMKLNST